MAYKLFNVKIQIELDEDDSNEEVYVVLDQIQNLFEDKDVPATVLDDSVERAYALSDSLS